MAVRIGVDVGGTFTKAVACDDRSGEIVAAATVPTSHEAALGVSEGVVAAAEAVKSEARTRGEAVVIAHSTTQAVNALLEGDTACVGVVGIGARPDLRRAAKRTRVGDIAIAPSRKLRTVHGFIDGTEAVRDDEVTRVLEGLREQGAQAICVSQAFGVEDARAEKAVARVARELGFPTCTGHEMTGLYGLEMRTVTGAVNASILPTALETAGFVQEAFSNGTRAALMVMRGDGGAADLSTMRRHPLATAFSGPAASVAGALRRSELRDGIVVEVGGTSTNISPVRGGRPVLSYIRVLDHVTCVRSLDARVAGIGGGSLLRATRRRRGLQLAGVGPRSAHIAGLDYCSFTTADLTGAAARLIAPRPGDPEEYLVLELPDGSRFAPTTTCAANALGDMPADSYARGNPEAARKAFEVIGKAFGMTSEAAARAVLANASATLTELIRATVAETNLTSPVIVGVGGGAGALVPGVARELGSEWHIPEHAEVISSVGDALSLVRVEVERTIGRTPDASFMKQLHTDAQERAITAGAAPDSLQVTSETIPERRAARAVATGSVALESGLLPATQEASAEDAELAAKHELGEGARLEWSNRYYSVFSVQGRRKERNWVVLDLRAIPVATGSGAVLCGPVAELRSSLQERVLADTKHLGPITVAPQLRVVTGATVTDLSCYTTPERVVDAAAESLADADGEAVVLFSRS